MVMATHAPHGHWIIITIFLVSPEDAGVAIDLPAVPATVVARTEQFDRDVRQAIETIAAKLEGKEGQRPDLQACFDELERAGADWPAPTVKVDASALAHLHGEIAVRRDVMTEVLLLSRAVGG
jgi:hypothetical protein